MSAPLFDPKDVKVADITAALAIGASANFAAPANANPTKIRYLLGAFFCINSVSAFYDAMAIEDLAGNLLIAGAPQPGNSVIILRQPLLVGTGANNGLRLTARAGGGAQNTYAWVQFADVRAALTAELFRS